MDSPHGHSGAVRGKPVALPAQSPDGGEPTRRKGSYSEELVKTDLHGENPSLSPKYRMLTATEVASELHVLRFTASIWKHDW